MKITKGPADPSSSPAPAPAMSPHPPQRPNLLPSKASHRQQRRRTRLRRAGAPTGKPSSRPETPLLRWRTEERERNAISIDVDDGGVSPPGAGCSRRRRDVPVSARKIAALLWRLNLPESVAPGGVGGGLSSWSKGEVLLGFGVIQCVRLMIDISSYCRYECD